MYILCNFESIKTVVSSMHIFFVAVERPHLHCEKWRNVTFHMLYKTYQDTEEQSKIYLKHQMGTQPCRSTDLCAYPM